MFRRDSLSFSRGLVRVLIGASAAGSFPGCSGSDPTILYTNDRSLEPGARPPAPAGGTDPATPGAAPPTEPGTATPPSANETPGGTPPLDPSGSSGAPDQPSPSGTPSAPGAAGSPGTPAVPVDPAGRNCEPPSGTLAGLHLTELATGLDQPTFATAAPGDDTRLFVLERSGAIRILKDGALSPEPFLDLRERVSTSNEEGLVGLAFHPNYAENGRFFVQYALLDPAFVSGQDQQIVLSEFARSPGDADHAEVASERPLMLVEQPSDIHLAGMLAFGPADGMLYISRGDGGSNDAQDTSSWLGKLLRIDVDAGSEDAPYGIPPGNMAGDGALPELWGMGLRNPWRFGFDPCTADMYIGDVGESSFEEINFAPANTPGRNYGWKTLEGPQCFEAQSCEATTFTPPVLTYEHDFGCSVISGYVYRGQRIPALRGTYLYADYCFGNFGSLRMENGELVDAQDITLDINPDDISLITSFGMDNAGELYVLGQLGSLYRIDPD